MLAVDALSLPTATGCVSTAVSTAVSAAVSAAVFAAVTAVSTAVFAAVCAVCRGWRWESRTLSKNEPWLLGT